MIELLCKTFLPLPTPLPSSVSTTITLSDITTVLFLFKFLHILTCDLATLHVAPAYTCTGFFVVIGGVQLVQAFVLECVLATPTRNIGHRLSVFMCLVERNLYRSNLYEMPKAAA